MFYYAVKDKLSSTSNSHTHSVKFYYAVKDKLSSTSNSHTHSVKFYYAVKDKLSSTSNSHTHSVMFYYALPALHAFCCCLFFVSLNFKKPYFLKKNFYTWQYYFVSLTLLHGVLLRKKHLIVYCSCAVIDECSQSCKLIHLS